MISIMRAGEEISQRVAKVPQSEDRAQPNRVREQS